MAYWDTTYYPVPATPRPMGVSPSKAHLPIPRGAQARGNPSEEYRWKDHLSQVSLSPGAQVSTHEDESTGAHLQSIFFFFFLWNIAKKYAGKKHFGIARDLWDV